MKAYKFRIYPNENQIILINKTFGSVRFVYNHFLNLKKESYKTLNKSPSKFDCAKLIPELKQEFEWLKEVDSIALQVANENLDSAYQMFFKKVNRFPNFKSKYDKQSYTTKNVNNNIKININEVTIPKVGKVKSKGIPSIKGSIKTLTLSRTRTNKYFVSIVTDYTPEKLPKVDKSVGIDLGIQHFATLSDGTKYENQRLLNKYQKKLHKEQKILARRCEVAKREGRKLSESMNYQKQKLKVAKIYEKISNCRMDCNHKLSTEIVKSHDVICIEDLSVKNMMKNRYLARSISDVSWTKFISMLRYKSDWYGRQLIEIDKWFPSSRLCSTCGENDGKKSLSVREWTCPNCGSSHDRDINAAINILNEGLSMI